MASKKNSGIVWIIVAVVIGIGIFNFGSSFISRLGRSSGNSTSSTSYTTDEDEAGSSGLDGSMEGVWPPGLGTNSVDLAEDLLTKNYYIVFDGSGSMDGERLAIAKEALKRFIQFVPEDANIGLLVFDDMDISERVTLGGSIEQFIDQVDLVRAGGGTPLSSAIGEAYDKINMQALKQLGYGEYNLVIVTDGEASGGYEPDRVVREILRKSPVTIHTIGFQIGRNHSLNQPGKILYKSAKDLDELSKGLEGVLAELEDFNLADFQDEN